MKSIVLLLFCTLLGGSDIFNEWKRYDFNGGGYAIHFYRDKNDNATLFHGYGFLTTDQKLMNELKECLGKMKFQHNYQVPYASQRVVVYQDQKPVKLHKSYIADSKFYLEDNGNWYVFPSANKIIRIINQFDKVYYEWEDLKVAPEYEKLK